MRFVLLLCLVVFVTAACGGQTDCLAYGSGEVLIGDAIGHRTCTGTITLADAEGGFLVRDLSKNRVSLDCAPDGAFRAYTGGHLNGYVTGYCNAATGDQTLYITFVDEAGRAYNGAQTVIVGKAFVAENGGADIYGDAYSGGEVDWFIAHIR